MSRHDDNFKPYNDPPYKTTSSPSHRCKLAGHHKFIGYSENYLEVECVVKHTGQTPHSNATTFVEGKTIYWPVTQVHLTPLKTEGTPSIFVYAVRTLYSLLTCPVWAVSQVKNWTCIKPSEFGPHTIHSWTNNPELYVPKRVLQAYSDNLLPGDDTLFDVIKDIKVVMKHPLMEAPSLLPPEWNDFMPSVPTKKKKKKEPYPEDVLSRESRRKRLVGGRHYPVPVEWIGHYSITNQEGEYSPVNTRIRRHLPLGRFKTEWGAMRAAWKLLDRYSLTTSALRLDYIQPLLPKELQTEGG